MLYAVYAVFDSNDLLLSLIGSDVLLVGAAVFRGYVASIYDARKCNKSTTLCFSRRWDAQLVSYMPLARLTNGICVISLRLAAV